WKFSLAYLQRFGVGDMDMERGNAQGSPGYGDPENTYVRAHGRLICDGDFEGVSEKKWNAQGSRTCKRFFERFRRNLDIPSGSQFPRIPCVLRFYLPEGGRRLQV
ncbi:unnamed protein product, partial [Ectocarpus sp. 8 AP-2014]